MKKLLKFLAVSTALTGTATFAMDQNKKLTETEKKYIRNLTQRANKDPELKKEIRELQSSVVNLEEKETTYYDEDTGTFKPSFSNDESDESEEKKTVKKPTNTNSQTYYDEDTGTFKPSFSNDESEEIVEEKTVKKPTNTNSQTYYDEDTGTFKPSFSPVKQPVKQPTNVPGSNPLKNNLKPTVKNTTNVPGSNTFKNNLRPVNKNTNVPQENTFKINLKPTVKNPTNKETQLPKISTNVQKENPSKTNIQPVKQPVKLTTPFNQAPKISVKTNNTNEIPDLSSVANGTTLEKMKELAKNGLSKSELKERNDITNSIVDSPKAKFLKTLTLEQLESLKSDLDEQKKQFSQGQKKNKYGTFIMGAHDELIQHLVGLIFAKKKLATQDLNEEEENDQNIQEENGNDFLAQIRNRNKK